MNAEAGYEESEQATPVRFAGFVCLLLGLISPVAMLGLPALVVPAVAAVFGLIALRPYRGEKPVGVTPAKIGLLLAILFASAGYFIVHMKTKTLGEQANFYTRQYIEVIARDYDEFAMELNKDFRNRFSDTMSLEDYYQQGNQPAIDALLEFQDNGAHAIIRKVGPDADWVLDRPVRVFKSYGIDRAEVVWRSTKSGKLIQFFMHYLVDPDDVAQWHIEHVQEYRELIVAESTL
jgi:hypothetical protein